MQTASMCRNHQGNNMPLRRIKNFCTATCKARQEPCKNPAAFGMPVCRVHGARKPESVARGAEHGRYKTGEFSQTSKAAYRAALIRLAELEAAGFRTGLLTGQRTCGRTPK